MTKLITLSKLKKNRKYQVLLSILLMCFLILICLLFFRVPTKAPAIKDVKEDSEINIVTYSVDTPEETPIDNSYVWPGSETDPKYIRIPSVEVNGYIINVGIDQNNAIAVPPNIHLAGWFVNTVRPGENGLSIIDGHVDGTNIGGIFRSLKDIDIGDEITIEMGDGKILKYTVRDKQIVVNAEAANILFSQLDNVKSQLNLITCGGTYLTDQETYDHRVIIMAELI